MSDFAESWVAYVIGCMTVAVPTLLGLGAATVAAATGRAALAGDLYRITVGLIAPTMLVMAAAMTLFRLRWVYRRTWAALTGRADLGRGTRFGVELAGAVLFCAGLALYLFVGVACGRFCDASVETFPFTDVTYVLGWNVSRGATLVGLVTATLGGFLQSLTPAPGDDGDDTSGYV